MDAWTLGQVRKGWQARLTVVLDALKVKDDALRLLLGLCETGWEYCDHHECKVGREALHTTPERSEAP